MSDNWKTLPLEECMEAIIDYRGKSPNKTLFGVPLVTAKVIKAGRIERPNEFIAEDDYDKWMRRGIPLKGDVVMTTEAPLGEVAQLDGNKVALAQRVITLRGKTALLDNTFLKFLLQSQPVQDELASRATGTTVMGIRQSELRKVRLTLPPIAEQEAIAHILGSLDAKIELNRRMSESLEAIARALFKSWFIDFDPVRAKVDGRTPDDMDEATARLFPDTFEDSELGPIPEGWRLMKLTEAFEVNPYRQLSKGKVAPYLDMQGMPTSEHHPSDWSVRAFGSGMKFQNGDTLVARITPCLENGKTAFVDFLPDGSVGWGSTEYIVFRPKPPLPPQYAYYLARTEEFRTFAIQNMTGTSGRQRVPSTCFEGYTVLISSEGVAKHFGAAAFATMERVRHNAEESRTLAATRDTLLPKLLSGELRIKDAERFVEAAL